MSNTKKDFSKKSNNIRQFTSSKPEWYSTSYEPTLPLPVLSHPDIPVGERLIHFVEQWGELNQIKWVLPIIQESFRTQFSLPSPLFIVTISLREIRTDLLH